MKKLIFLMFFLMFYGCNKPKTVLICGDHICINKAEAEQYFEENLTLEVKIIDKDINRSKNIDLVEVNLQSNKDGGKKVTISNKKQTNKKLKVLSKKEIKNKKKEIKNKNKVLKKEIKKVQLMNKDKLKNSKNDKKQLTDKLKKDDKTINICNILETCSIDEISKYLVKQGKNKSFPDITLREQNEKK